MQAGCEVVESAALKIVGNPEKVVILAVFDITQIRRGRGYVVIRYVIYLKVVSEDRTHRFRMDHTLNYVISVAIKAAIWTLQ